MIEVSHRERARIVGYLRRFTVPDMLIRDVPEAVIAVLDANAARLGLSE